MLCCLILLLTCIRLQDCRLTSLAVVLLLLMTLCLVQAEDTIREAKATIAQYKKASASHEQAVKDSNRAADVIETLGNSASE